MTLNFTEGESSVTYILSGKIQYRGEDDEIKLLAQTYFNKHKHKKIWFLFHFRLPSTFQMYIILFCSVVEICAVFPYSINNYLLQMNNKCTFCKVLCRHERIPLGLKWEYTGVYECEWVYIPTHTHADDRFRRTIPDGASNNVWRLQKKNKVGSLFPIYITHGLNIIIRTEFSEIRNTQKWTLTVTP